ncbi:type II toxin-antitoxin system HicB family antitoxin [Arvimicrobium flavum]|uniref:type II toxin-antitoxin system HicB family antitoxin n=1 Tax=Arvimicrobium flavum TaxID=3393320 RepID=UPI00237C3D75|nr:type II toxin-antitoxin system HicB family antitoxin [Mesorhizobium shangrilense]
MATHYIALIHKEPGSGYGVSFPDIPGVTAVADTLDEALHEASVALGFAFEDWEGACPSVRSLDELRADSDFLDMSKDAVVAAVTPAASLKDAA